LTLVPLGVFALIGLGLITCLLAFKHRGIPEDLVEEPLTESA
jgi:hypothetical protein